VSRLIGRERTLTLVCAGAASGAAAGHALTDAGVAQAQQLASYVATLPPARAIYTSDRADAHGTARILSDALDGVPVHRAAKLRECIPGRPAHDEPQSEPFADLVYAAGARHADGAFARWFIPARLSDKHEVLVTHPNLLRALVCRTMGVDPLAWTSIEVGPAGVSRVRAMSDGRLRLLCLNERGFLAASAEALPF
jgi:broad specificity phosphatase PhoE